MSPEPQDVLTLDVKRKLENVLARHYLQTMTDGPYAPCHGMQTFERIAAAAWAHHIATEAMECEMFAIQGLPMDERRGQDIIRAVRGASRRLTYDQRSQWARWRQHDGEMRRATLGLVITWRVPPAWVAAMSDTQLEETTRRWLLPLLAMGFGVPLTCFSEPLVSWVVEPDRRAQGIALALLRED